MSHAYLAAGEYEKAAAHDHDDPPIVTTLAPDLMGQRDRAIAHIRQQLVRALPAILRMAFGLFLAGLEGRRTDALTAGDEILAKWRLRAVDGGYYCYPFLTRDPWLDSLRGNSEFKSVVQVAEAGYRDAAAAFAAAGGETLLGPADAPQ